MVLNFLRFFLACLCLSITFVSPSNADSSENVSLKQQRAIYDKAHKLLDNRQFESYEKVRPKIAGYPLTPYLDYRRFLIGISHRSPDEVRNFIHHYNDFPFSNRISAPYLDGLAREKKWKLMLEYQIAEPRGETYQCYYYYAQAKYGNREEGFRGAQKLWLSGHGIADACDPLFSLWDKVGLRSEELILKRMHLAFEARNRSLMHYLANLLKSQKAKRQADEMKVLFDSPIKVRKFARKHQPTTFHQNQVILALKKLARSEIEKAVKLFPEVVKAQKISRVQAQELADYLAFRMINTERESLAQWRDNKISSSSNTALIERRVRLAIQEANWSSVIKWIDILPKDKQNSLRWQYWLARSELALGQHFSGQQRMESIIGQRNFYSVAAAKELQRSIHYPTSEILLNHDIIDAFDTELIRIEELIERDKIEAGKSEWRWLLDRADAQQRRMLAAYAAFKGWHHFTVMASIKAQMWDNISIRFPIAHRWWFNFYGDKHSIDPITLMSLARQESGLDIEAISPVGARGIMQIMPSTAKYTAKKYKLAYRGTQDLYSVGKNIEIGSHYLDGLLNQYNNNRIFALAAYNAGPHRVKTWRKRTQGKLDAYAFIEAIPFKETRGYVQNILMFETYYREVLGVDGAFLNPHELKTKY